MTAPLGNRRIVVGVDGSPASMSALRWASDEAQRRGVGLDIVHAWSAPVTMYSEGIVYDPDAFERRANDVLATAVAAVQGFPAPPTDVHPTLTEGDPAEALVTAAVDADLLVISSRGMGGFTGLLLGSVSESCIEDSPCPVAVIPEESTAAPEHKVVVGVDGSPPSFRALEWAMAEAAVRGAHLDVVIADHHDDEAGRAVAQEMVDKALAEAAAKPPDVTVTAISGGAVPSLIEAGAGAELLVLGARGRSRWRRALLGSVSRQTVHHARGPVVIVHERQGAPAT